MINKLICQMLCLDASGAQETDIICNVRRKHKRKRDSQSNTDSSQSHSSFVRSPCESLRPRTKPAVVEESRNGGGQLKLLLLKGVREQKQWDHFSVI